MTRFFCDHCEKEVEKLTEIRVPTKKNKNQTFETKTLMVCDECRMKFEAIADKICDIRIIMFGDFVEADASDTEANRDDLVKVLRCKDCAYFECGYLCTGTDENEDVKPDDYCSRGIRTDGM